MRVRLDAKSLFFLKMGANTLHFDNDSYTFYVCHNWLTSWKMCNPASTPFISYLTQHMYQINELKYDVVRLIVWIFNCLLSNLI